jgi:hypothetical protein
MAATVTTRPVQRRAAPARPSVGTAPPWTLAAVTRGALAFCSLGAAAIHYSVAPEHFHEWTAFRLFFTALAVGQAAWAVGVLVRPSRPQVWGGATASALTVSLWVVTRTAGLPVGPHHWSPEPWGRNDGICAALEVAIVLGAAMATTRSARRVGRGTARGAVALAALGVSVAVGIALSPLAMKMEADPPAAPGASTAMAGMPAMAGMHITRGAAPASSIPGNAFGIIEP